MNELPVRAVIFDLGSTLIEYEPVPWPEMAHESAIALREYLAGRGYALPDEAEFVDLTEQIKGPLRTRAAEEYIEWNVLDALTELFSRLNCTVAHEERERAFDAYYEPVGTRLFRYDDTLDTLEKLVTRYGRVGLISNTIFPERVHQRELDRFTLRPFLRWTIFSSTFSRRKPHPEIFRAGCRLMESEPGETVYIGDRFLEDVTGPRSIGMQAILKEVPNRDYPNDYRSQVRVIGSLSELPDLLDI